MLVKDHSERENIRCHELQKGELLPQLLDTFKKNCCKAVILINISDDYKLQFEFTSGVELCLPVVVVSKSDGKKILDVLKGDKACESVYAKINMTCRRSEIILCMSGWSYNHELLLLFFCTHAQITCINVFFCQAEVKMKSGLYLKPDLATYLSNVIDKLMFNAKEPLLIAVDQNRFSKIMSAFHNYEKMVSYE